MVTTKEFSIIRALVEEEMIDLKESMISDENAVLASYYYTLSNIIEKLKQNVTESEFSQELLQS